MYSPQLHVVNVIWDGVKHLISKHEVDPRVYVESQAW